MMATTTNSWHNLYLYGYRYIKLLFAVLNSSVLLILQLQNHTVQSIPKDTIKANEGHHILFLHIFNTGFVTGVVLEGKQTPTRNQG